MNPTKLLWICTFAFMICLSLLLLRLSSVIGSEFDILIQLVSVISLVLLGVFAGGLISQKQIRVQAVLLPSLLFVLGFLAAPFVGIVVLMLFENFGFDMPVIFAVSMTAYLFLYMGLWFWLKRRGTFKRQNP
jgi:NO-binding membrane sensor protein with MHYT domain